MRDFVHWSLLRQGKIEEGMRLARAEHARDPHLMKMDLGIAYLWTGDYQSAAEHFQGLIDKEPFTVDKFFEMAGVARWCADDPKGAVEYWHQGVGSQLADSGVAISLALLLFVASVLRPAAYSRKDAERILQKQLKSPRAAKWPGPLAEFVLGRIDAKTLQRLCTGRTESETVHKRWRAEFYGHVVALAAGDLRGSAFTEAMRTTADTTRPEWFQEREFKILIWSAEFYIARHEASSKISREVFG